MPNLNTIINEVKHKYMIINNSSISFCVVAVVVVIVIITKVVSSNPVHSEVYSIQHYVTQFVSDLRQVSGFLRILRFPPSIKLTATI